MNISPKKRTVLTRLTIVTAGIVFANVFLARGPGHATGQAAHASSSPPPVIIEPQPTSPVQILSVTPVTAQPPTGFPASRVADLKAYNVVLRNVAGHDVVLYALQFTSTSGPHKGGTFNSAAFFATGPREPALAAGQTKSGVLSVFLRGDQGGLAIHVDVVALDNGTVYGKNKSRAFDTFVDNLDTQQGVDRGILSMLETDGPEATQRFLKERLAYLDEAVPKFTSPEWVE